jgi:hypothetical protein
MDFFLQALTIFSNTGSIISSHRRAPKSRSRTSPCYKVGPNFSWQLGTPCPGYTLLHINMYFFVMCWHCAFFLGTSTLIPWESNLLCIMLIFKTFSLVLGFIANYLSCSSELVNFCRNTSIFSTYFFFQLYLDLANSEKALQYLDKVLVIDGRWDMRIVCISFISSF